MNNKLSITDLADQLSDVAGISKKEATSFVKTLFDIIEENLIKDKIVKLKSFGTFKLIWVESRRIANVNTGEIQEIPGHYKTTFTTETELSEAVNEPFAHLETVVLDDEIIADEPTNSILQDSTPEENNTADYPLKESELSSFEPTPKQNEEIKDILLPITVKETSTKEESISETEAPKTNLEDTSLIVSPIKQTTMKSEDEEPDLENEIEDNDEDAQSDKKVKRWIIALLILAILAFAAYFIYYNSKGGKINLTQNIPTYEEMAKLDSVDKVATPEDTAASSPSMETVSKTPQQTETPIQATASPNANQQKTVATNAPKQEVKPAPKQAPALPLSTKDKKTEKQKISPQYNKTKDKDVSTKAEVVTTTAKSTKEIGKTDKTGDKKIVKEVMKPGSRLTLLAQKHYGNKAFWVYIYQANKAKINDPNNVPVGTELIIPSKDSYSIDSENSKSINKAKNIAKSILK